MEDFGRAMNLELFDSRPPAGARQAIGVEAFVLRGFALPSMRELLAAIAQVESVSPFRHMVTPGGLTMSVALTNCGELGWVTDRRGYRYTPNDPQTAAPWPPMPESFSRLARGAAAAAGFEGFAPDACLINRYAPGSRLSLHQDKDERDFDAPIVSVSLGVPAVFLFGGHTRRDRAQRVPLHHGDVVVWGGADRLRYHGILPIKDAFHPDLGTHRINFTFRKAG
ncbi:MAG TPA: DNA oxidative demethylase AlkB [Kofleriaceae bacterium]|nr:DNA oxidative demethylase AlkB [Kofleriaceae bacterium]